MKTCRVLITHNGPLQIRFIKADTKKKALRKLELQLLREVEETVNNAVVDCCKPEEA